MGSALGSSSVQTSITSYTHQLRHTEAQDAISSFTFECGIPLKTPGTQHGMWDAVRKAGPRIAPTLLQQLPHNSVEQGRHESPTMSQNW
jgi:hypothetical protein